MNTEDKAPICQNCSQDPAVTGYHICYGCAHDIENNGDDDLEWFDEAVWINASIEYAHRIDTDDDDTAEDEPIG